MYVAITSPGVGLPSNGMGAFKSGAPFPWPVRPRRSSRRGLGATLGQELTTGISAGATTGAATAIGTGSAIAGGIAGGLLAAAPFTGPAAPFLAAAGLIVGPIASLFKGCGTTCQQTTDIANKVADAAGQITSLYWGQPVRTQSMQAAAISNLQQLYQYLIQNCQAIGGQGGQQCIADRQPGGKYDFQAQQIAPIQNDQAVVPDPVASGSSILPGGISVPALPANLSGLMIPAALALGAWWLLE